MPSGKAGTDLQLLTAMTSAERVCMQSTALIDQQNALRAFEVIVTD